MTDATGNVTTQGSQTHRQPGLHPEPGHRRQHFQIFGDMTWTELTDLADKRYAGEFH